MIAMVFALLLSAQPMLRPTPLEVAAAMVPAMQAESPGALVTAFGSSSYAEIAVRGERFPVIERVREIQSSRLMDGSLHVLDTDQVWPMMALRVQRPDNAFHPVPPEAAAPFDREYGRLPEQRR